jgi:5-oxoprolinase (ATP-hydrolysing)
MADDRWQFWLDVGGTFTDCIARQSDGTLLRRKVLSSAVTKGRGRYFLGNSETLIRSKERTESDGFWAGYGWRIVGPSGVVQQQGVVTSSQHSFFQGLPYDDSLRGQDVQYELLSPEEAPLLAIRLFLGLRLDQPIPPCVVRLGTTRGTNALLTRRGAKTALVTTKGHGDVLRIGYQNRPKLFELAIKKPEPLFSDVAEIDERVAADGSILVAPNQKQVHTELARLKAAGIESLAICLLNAYAYPVHEAFVGQIAREMGFTNISLSHEVSSLMKIVPRGDTTVVDAYLNPVLQTYVARLAAALPGSDLRLMTSAGGTVSAANFTGKDSILSGPAGGVVGFSKVAQAAGFDKAIGFDMGGTSTDVSRFDGKFEYEYETEKAGVRIVAPMLAIETVAAGGGSICKWDGIKLTVGPDSAGADPGPACYGRGGPLTITDCNFYLGRILPEHFPFPLDRTAVEARLAEVEAAVRAGGSRNAAEGVPYSAEALAEGFVRIANTHMAQAIRSISVAKGYDPRDYVLVAFGAAAPQHACGVARELGIRQVLLHPDTGVLSALGIGLADVTRHRTAGIYRLLTEESLPAAAGAFRDLTAAAAADVEAETGPVACDVTRALDLRYAGTDVPLTVAEPAGGDYATSFANLHRQRYGYVQSGRPIEIVAARVEATARFASTLPRSSRSAAVTMLPEAANRIFHEGQLLSAATFQRNKLAASARITGPAILI